MLQDRPICPLAPYGEHITLGCKNHPELCWSTKNIEYIGARSIFFDGARNQQPDENLSLAEYIRQAGEAKYSTPECECKGVSSLYHDCQEFRCAERNAWRLWRERVEIEMREEYVNSTEAAYGVNWNSGPISWSGTPEHFGMVAEAA